MPDITFFLFNFPLASRDTIETDRSKLELFMRYTVPIDIVFHVMGCTLYRRAFAMACHNRLPSA